MGGAREVQEGGTYVYRWLIHVDIWQKRGSDGEVSAYNAGDPGSIPGLGRSPEEGNGSPLRYSCLENPMDRGALQPKVYRVAKSQAQSKRLST